MKEMIRITDRKPDYKQFLKILERKEKPDYFPFYEHVASPEVIARHSGTDWDKRKKGEGKDYWKIYVDFWMSLGFDIVPMEIPLNCPLPNELGGFEEGGEIAIRTMDDFLNYEWPTEENAIDFHHFEEVAKHLPEGAKIVGGVAAGPYEWVVMLMGVMGMSYAFLDDPELIKKVFAKVASLHIAADKRLAKMDSICALRQGDDLGFKTSTFLSPTQLREFVFPTYKKMVNEATKQGKKFLLHSCGNLGAVYNDIIDCGFAAKHSYEDIIMPVADFKKEYGDRITALGGLDVDFICRKSKEEIVAYTKAHIDSCGYDGLWALGTGNSLTDYIPFENYLTMLKTGLTYKGKAA